MTEKKTSVYDSGSESTPLVHADRLQPDGDLFLVRNAEGVDPSASRSANVSAVEEVPTILTEEEEQSRARIVGAGVASGVFGLLLTGPIGAMLLGFGASYAAEKKEGLIGDTARAVGDLALSARDKAREIDEKHHVVDKSKAAASEAWERAKEADRKHKILERTKEFVIYSWNSVVDFIRRHNLIERGVNGIGKGVCWAMEKVGGGLDRAVAAEPYSELQASESSKKGRV